MQRAWVHAPLGQLQSSMQRAMQGRSISPLGLPLSGVGRSISPLELLQPGWTS
jgi:hypothetical protein